MTNLCTSCLNAQVIEQGNKTTVLCNLTSPYTLLHEPVQRCSAYYHKNLPTRYDMEQIAWTIRIGKKNGKVVVGFEPPAKL